MPHQFNAVSVQRALQYVATGCCRGGQKIVQLPIAETKQDTYVTAASTAGLVDQSRGGGSGRELIMASIEYAEIMVNTELSQRFDVGRVLAHYGRCRSPGRGHRLGRAR